MKDGLGIRKVKDVNAAFLAKQGWKFLTQPDWVRIVKDKYVNEYDNFFSMKKTSAVSTACKSILDQRHLIKIDLK